MSLFKFPIIFITIFLSLNGFSNKCLDQVMKNFDEKTYNQIEKEVELIDSKIFRCFFKKVDKNGKNKRITDYDLLNLSNQYKKSLEECEGSLKLNEIRSLEESLRFKCNKKYSLQTLSKKLTELTGYSSFKNFSFFKTELSNKISKLKKENELKLKKQLAEKELEKRNAKIRYSKGLDLISNICTYKYLVDYNKKAVNDEKEASKISGYVDKNKLYTHGKDIYVLNKSIRKWKKDYFKRTGRNFKNSLCRNKR